MQQAPKEPPKATGRQHPVYTSDALYERSMAECRRLGLRSFAAFVRHVLTDWFDTKRPA